jgi:MFS family permease
MTAAQAAPAQRSARGRIAAAWRSGPLSRLGGRRLMLAPDLTRCALTAALATLAVSHDASLAVLAPLTALLGAASALFMPASMTMMPSLVDGERLTSANAVYTGFVLPGSMLGPVLGGVLVAATGPATGFAVDAASYLASAVSLALIAGAGGRRLRAAATNASAVNADGAANTGVADAGGAEAGRGGSGAAARRPDAAGPRGRSSGTAARPVRASGRPLRLSRGDRP